MRRSARSAVGQATVEAIGLWLAFAALAGALGLALDASGVPRRVADGLAEALASGQRRNQPQQPSAAALAYARAAVTHPSGPETPTLLGAEARLVYEVGADRARELVESIVLGRYGAATAVPTPMVVQHLDGPLIDPRDRHTHRELLTAAGPVRVHVTTPAEEERAGQSEERGGSGLEFVTGAALALGSHGVGEAVHALAAIGVDVGVALGNHRHSGSALRIRPGERSSDAILCQPLALGWYLDDEPAGAPVARGVRRLVVRDGVVIEPPTVYLDVDRCR